MPKTEIQDEVPRANPYITKGISKKFLTPCRQMGLSRKRKTPNSTSNSFSETPPSDTTPVSSSKPPDDVKEESKSKPDSDEIPIRKCKRNSKVSKRLISDDDTSSNDSDINYRKKKLCSELQDSKLTSDVSNNTSPKKSSFIQSKNEKKTEYERIEDENTLQHTSEISNETLKKDNTNVDSSDEEKSISDLYLKRVTKVYNKRIKNKNNVEKIAQQELESQQLKKSTEITKSQPKEKSKKIKKIILTQKVKSDRVIGEDSNKEIETSEVLKEVTNKEEVIKIAKETKSIETHSKNQTSEMPQKSSVATIDKNNKMKRSLSMKRSSSDDKDSNLESMILKECYVTLVPDLEPQMLPNKINELRKQIKDKIKLVDELKQAEIYKKKHNLEELKELTAQFKKGCISALNDLLPQLNQHANIDMSTLLCNLGIPPEKISLSPEGDLV